MSSSSSRLSEAAEELVKAAQVDVASTAQNQQLTASLEALKASFDTKLNTIQQVVKHSETNFDDKINTINQSIIGLKNEITSLKKTQALAWAIQNAEVGAFRYYKNEDAYNDSSSSSIIIPILCAFRRGLGHFVGNGTMIRSSYDSERKKSQEEYRTKLIEQIHTLTGVKPRMEKTENGRYAVYYS